MEKDYENQDNQVDVDEILEIDNNEEDGDEEMEDSNMEQENAEEAEEEEDEEGMIQQSDEMENHQDDSSVCFTYHNDSVYCIDSSPTDKDIVVSGGGDDKAYIWNTNTGKILHQLSGHTDSVTAVKFSSSGKHVATGGMEGIVKVWEVSTANLVSQLEGPNEITWLSWHPKGNIVLGGANDGSCWMWMSNGQVMQVFSGHTSEVTVGGFTSDGKNVVTGSEDGSVIVWDPKNANPLSKFNSNDARFNQAPITSIGFSNDSSILLIGSQDGAVKAVHALNGKILASFESHSDSVECIEFSKVIPLAATCGLDGKICTWDISTMRQRHAMSHDDGVVKIKWHPTEPFIFSCSVDKTVRVWDARTGQCLKIFKGHTQPILDMAISFDALKVITASDDHTCLVFDVFKQ